MTVRTSAARTPADRVTGLDTAVLVLLVVDAVILSVLSVLYLPARLGSAPFPLSALVSGVVNVVLVLEACRITRRSWLRALPLIAWTVVFALCTFGGPGGDVLLAADWRTALLLVVGALPALVVLLRRVFGDAVARGAAARR